MLAAIGTSTEIAASIARPVSFVVLELSTVTVDMIAGCTVVGTKIAESGP